MAKDHSHTVHVAQSQGWGVWELVLEGLSRDIPFSSLRYLLWWGFSGVFRMIFIIINLDWEYYPVEDYLFLFLGHLEKTLRCFILCQVVI